MVLCVLSVSLSLFREDYQHGQVPKTVDLQKQFETTFEGAPTTLMIRNIPNSYTQRELLKELESLGFAKAFDFLYMPVDKGQGLV